MAQLLAEAVANDDEYARASRLHRSWLERGVDLGTNGVIGWTAGRAP